MAERRASQQLYSMLELAYEELAPLLGVDRHSSTWRAIQRWLGRFADVGMQIQKDRSGDLANELQRARLQLERCTCGAADE